jgi:hypothetical protein
VRDQGPGIARSEQRRRTILALEHAANLSPGDTVVLDRLAHAYLDAGFTLEARQTFGRVLSLAPATAGAWEGLGLAWKRDWLTTLARASLDSAVENLAQATRLDPSRAQTWTMLAVLRVEQADARGAGLAAEAARAATPESTGATLASAYLAYLEYRAGRLVPAESLFTEAIARMPVGRDGVTSRRSCPRTGGDWKHVTRRRTEACGGSGAPATPAHAAGGSNRGASRTPRCCSGAAGNRSGTCVRSSTCATARLRRVYRPPGIPLADMLNRFPQYQPPGQRHAPPRRRHDIVVSAARPGLGYEPRHAVLLEDDAISSTTSWAGSMRRCRAGGPDAACAQRAARHRGRAWRVPAAAAG